MMQNSEYWKIRFGQLEAAQNQKGAYPEALLKLIGGMVIPAFKNFRHCPGGDSKLLFKHNFKAMLGVGTV